MFFDIDDTLYSTSEFARLARRASVRAMIEAGLKTDEDNLMRELDEIVIEFSSNYEHHFDKLLLRIPAQFYRGINPAVIIAAGVAAYHDTKFHQLKIYEDVKIAFEKLSKTNLLLGVITVGNAIKQAEKLLRLHVLKYINPKAIFISDQIGISKPNVKLFKWALRKTAIPASQAMYIGDNPVNDIDPPNKIGMITVRNNRGGKYASVIGKTAPDYEIKTFLDLLEILKKDFSINVD